MTGQPTSKPTCPSCGAEVPPDAPRGYCLKCLFALGTAEPDSLANAASPSPGGEGRGEGGQHSPHSADFPLRSFGDYELLEEIARGGMGVVYKARQKSLGRIVAVKMLLFGDQSGKEQAQRFRAEAAAAASLQHPNIVAIHEVSAHEGQPFFVMDFIEGQNLAKLSAECEVRNAEWLRRAARYVRIVAEAIHYAHERGILHRDLKPSNVLIDPFDQPRVTDFGLAKRLHHDSELTLSGQVLGSPNYMPPEQAAAKRGLVGRRSDVYSLGAILYHLLAGRPPFVGETLTETLQDVVNKEPVSSRLLNPSVPRDLETLCLKCLEKEPARRYQTAQALTEDLDRFLRNEPIHARPVGPAEKMWRWCRRKPLIASLGAATLLLLLAVAIGSPMAIYRINHERQRAVRGELDARQKAYASDMKLAQQALAQNNLGRAQYLLDRHRPKGKSEIRNPKSEIQDLRGWEWRYLWQQCQSDALFTLCQKSNGICSLALSPDGKWLAVGEEDKGRLSIWDLEKREDIMRFPADEGPVFAVFSPRERLLAFSSGGVLPSVNRQCRVRFWDGDTKRILPELPLDDSCRGLAFSDDGETLATITAGEEGQLTLWKVPEGTMRSRHPAGKLRYLGSLFAVARDLSVAAYAVLRDEIRVVDLHTGLERWIRKPSDEYVTALAISPDGKILASAGGFAPSPIRLWDLASGKMIGESVSSESQRGYVCSLVFSPDGKTLASGSSDQAIRLWDTDGLRLRRTLLGHKGEVWSLALLPDNRTLVSGCQDGSVCVWDTEASGRVSPHVRLPESFIAWSFATNGQTVLTCDRQGRVAQRQGSDFAEERMFEIGMNISAATFLPERSMVVVAGVGGGEQAGTATQWTSHSHIQVWNLSTRSRIRELALPNSPPQLWFCLAQGNRLIIGDAASQSLHEWDLTTWQVRVWPAPAQLYSGDLSPDGRWCVTLGFGGASMINDLTTGRTRAGNFEIRQHSGVTFSADGKLLAVVSMRGSGGIWDAATLQPIGTLRGSQGGDNVVAFSPDSQRLATCGLGKETLTLWDVESHEELLFLGGKGTSLSPPAFSPDGTVLGSMSVNGVLHLWRAPSWAEIEAAEKEAGK